MASIGVDSSEKHIEKDESKVCLQLWDSSGQDVKQNIYLIEIYFLRFSFSEIQENYKRIL